MLLDEYNKKKEQIRLAKLFAAKVYDKELFIESLKFKLGITFQEEMPEFLLHYVEEILDNSIDDIIEESIVKMEEDLQNLANEVKNEYYQLMVDSGIKL